MLHCVASLEFLNLIMVRCLHLSLHNFSCSTVLHLLACAGLSECSHFSSVDARRCTEVTSASANCFGQFRILRFFVCHFIFQRRLRCSSGAVAAHELLAVQSAKSLHLLHQLSIVDAEFLNIRETDEIFSVRLFGRFQLCSDTIHRACMRRPQRRRFDTPTLELCLQRCNRLVKLHFLQRARQAQRRVLPHQYLLLLFHYSALLFQGQRTRSRCLLLARVLIFDCVELHLKRMQRVLATRLRIEL